MEHRFLKHIVSYKSVEELILVEVQNITNNHNKRKWSIGPVNLMNLAVLFRDDFCQTHFNESRTITEKKV